MTTTVTATDALSELPADIVTTEPATLEQYRWDWSHDPACETPLAVVRPRDTAEVTEVMRWATRHRVPVVPRGAGTSLSGGSRGIAGAITLSLERMTTVEVDPRLRVVVAQPGALNTDVKAAAAHHGLWYPPDPSSFEMCSIGGNVATNAGGLCCVKYGVTRDFLLALEVVLVDGTVVRLGAPLVKNVAGLSLKDLFVGSEGSLGIVTEITSRLLPAPRVPATLVATFASTAAAADATVAIMSALRPSMLELMDSVSVNAVEDMTAMGLDRSAGALLLARSDAGGAGGEAEIAEIARCCEQAGAAEVYSTTDEVEGEALVSARRLALVALERRGTNLLEDTGVPVPSLPDLLAGIAQISSQNDIEIAVVAHAGDGNTHPVIVVDRGDPEAMARARVAFGAIMDLAVSLGGTITGEHGVGHLKKEWLESQIGPEVMALQQRVKTALDPDGLLNPGVSGLH